MHACMLAPPPAMAHLSHHYYAAALDVRTTELELESESDSFNHPFPSPSSSSSSSAFRLNFSQLQRELAEFETRCAQTRQALHFKTSETNAMKQYVALLEAQLSKSEHTIATVKDQLSLLALQLSNLHSEQLALQLQLELDRSNHIRNEEEWGIEREELKAQVAHLETELQLATCSDGELDFLITPVKKGSLHRGLGSPRTSNGLSLQTLLDMGEASLEVEEDIHELKLRLADAEAREQRALHALGVKDEQLQDRRKEVKQLEEEVAAEKDKAKEEAEDLTQEMAELRFQLIEMIEQERELRAQAEQASVLRVEELESQLKNARQEVVLALSSRREAEMQSDRLALEIQRLWLALELQNAAQELKHSKEMTEQAQAEVEQRKEDLISTTKANAKFEQQVQELRLAQKCLSTKSQQLKGTLDKAVARNSELVESSGEADLALHALMEQESNVVESKREVENIFEDALEEQVKGQGDALRGTEGASDQPLVEHESVKSSCSMSSTFADMSLTTDGASACETSPRTSDTEKCNNISSLSIEIKQLEHNLQDGLLGEPDFQSGIHAP